MTFVQVLIFAFGFFGVWLFKDAATSGNWPTAAKYAAIGLAFVVISWLLAGGKIG